MFQIEDFVDSRQKSWCIHCGRNIREVEVSRDHVPSKSLLRTPFPPNLPTVPICKGCNEKFARDEEYFAAFLGSVLSGTTDPDQQLTMKATRRLRRNSKLRARIDGGRKEHQVRGGQRRILWRPEEQRIQRVIVKNARGHAFYEMGEPMTSKPASVWAKPLEVLTNEQRTEFENIDTGPRWAEVGSRMLTRQVTGQDLQGQWVIVQPGVYRYALAQVGVMLVRTVLNEYLATEVYWSE